MRGKPWWVLVVAVVALFVPPVPAQEPPVAPYVDPAQLDVPFPKHSHYRQPWRGFLETRAGDDFLRGVGVNYNAPGNDELAVRLLAEAGIRAFRIEVGWGDVRPDEAGLNDGDRKRRVLRLCREHGVRPLILLNAHQGVPCPMRSFTRRVAADAPVGSRSVKLADAGGLVAGRSGLSDLTGYWAAEAIVTSVDPATGECRLSKPLPKPLKAGVEVKMATLAYAPLYPVGTPEFDATAAGWVKYALLICRLVREARIADFDVEIWNELGFGTEFLDVNHYHDPAVARPDRDPLNEGGRCWELARRTVEAVHKEFPGVRCVWGFSNTTFFHTQVERLPPGTDGQSYHPYGTGTRKLPEQEYHRDRPDENVDGFTPTTELRLPEGWAHTFIQTESLMRLLNPEARQRHPAGTTRFLHFMTEHGVAPPECGVRDEAGAWELKTRCALRSYCMYLNKGVAGLYYFSAYDRAATGMGLLPPDLTRLPADAPFEQVAPPPLRAIRGLTHAFAGSVPLRATEPLGVDVTAQGAPVAIFAGDATHPPLRHRDAFAFLPFQVSPGRHVVAVYVATYDAIKPMTEEPYRLSIRGVNGREIPVRLDDPVSGRSVPVRIVRRDADRVEVELTVVDYPRLLTLGR